MTDEEKFHELLTLTKPDGTPNINALWHISKDLEAIKLNIKFFGYELARQLAAAIPIKDDIAPNNINLSSKASTQSDIESDWCAYWCSQLKIPVIFHRKIWEMAFVLQTIYANNKMFSGAKGIGFGCGEEPLPSYFSSKGIDITVTDLSKDEAAGRGWVNTNQHTSSLDTAFKAHLTTREQFDKHVSLEYVDMNKIPDELTGYDFCWSICAFEHLGSIENGIKFIENSLKVLKQGGISVHTTEFNFLNDNETIDNWGTVLFQKKHFEEMKCRLEASGHKVMPLDFDIGDKPMDKFIDIPPFVDNLSDNIRLNPRHIKVNIDGFACTCFGIIVIKG